MPIIKLEKSRDFTVLPKDSLIKVRVEEITETELDGKYGPWTKLDFKFTITEVYDESYKELVGKPIWGGVNANFYDDPECQLKQWAEALLGFELTPPFDLDTDSMLVGREAKAVTTTYQKSNGAERHQVESLIPAGSTVSVPQPPATSPTLDEATAPPESVTVPSPTDDIPF